MRFDIKGKLASRFIVSFEILKHIGKVAYRLALLMFIDDIHNVFYVSFYTSISMTPPMC